MCGRTLLTVVFCLSSAAAGAAEAWGGKLTAKGVEFFESKIRPVLVQRCYSCHSSKSEEVKGGLLVDTKDGLRKGGDSGAAVVPSNVDESLLIQALRYETFEMPPGDKLPDDVIAAFEEWIEMGAPDPRVGKAQDNRKIKLSEARSHWAFQGPALVPPPALRNDAWPASEIDRYILARLEAAGLQPVPDADRYTLLRRVTFDLTGLPPSPQDVEQFANSQQPEAYTELVDRLLDSPQFGERWGRHWLDVARYGESTGKERNVVYPYAWRYRNYVIDAFNADKPFDRFIREQVAGDLLPAANAAERNTNLVATGFLAIGTKSLNERNREQYLMDVADEQLDVTTRAFLGITVACARCHDHKFDPLTVNDYYSLAGVFRSTEILAGVKPGNNKSGYDGEFQSLASTNGRPEYTPEQRERIATIPKQIKEARDKLALAVQAQKAVGKKAAEKRKKAAAFQVRLKERIERLEAELKQVRENPGEKTELAMAVRDAAKPANCKINVRGDVKELGPEVPRGIPVVLAIGRLPRFDTPQSGRLPLAGWLASRDNPLTARVMANRVWAHLLGTGIVEPVDNFGALAEPPSHPELLDYLALRLMEQGWSVKKLVREIVMSRTYRMSSQHEEDNYARDADNRWLWRMNRRRLEAEAIRDSILAVSGQLDRERPSLSPAIEMAGVEFGRGRQRGASGFDASQETYRSVYLPLFRGGVPDVLAVFDMADPSLMVHQREVTTVATQALFMMNSPFVVRQSQHLAQHLLASSDGSDQARVEQLFLSVLGRPPNRSEREKSLEYLHDLLSLTGKTASRSAEERNAAWASLCQTLIGTAEFRYAY